MSIQSACSRFDWDIFCRVVDNFGDIGVSWRLAKGLARDHGLAVRLWVDDWNAFRRLAPQADAEVDTLRRQGVDVRRWREPFAETAPARNVVEAFGCELPQRFQAAMAACEPQPLWVNLEYLSAEPWILGCHGLSSPHPRLPLTKRFFFPGFTPGTGGLLREAGLLTERDRFRNDPAEPAALLASLGVGDVHADAQLVSLFAYENPSLEALLGRWTAEDAPLLLLVPEGRVVADVARFFGAPGAQPGQRFRHGALDVRILPFVYQDRYDRLLWSCDLNFVRGEDSFVRAQWAGRPFVWHIYAQDEEAHRVKLDAFLDLHAGGLDPGSARAFGDFSRAWNGWGDAASKWHAFRSALPAIRAHTDAWTRQLAALEDLSSALVKLAGHRL